MFDLKNMAMNLLAKNPAIANSPRYGEAFNRFRSAKRHYTETHSEKDHQAMKEHANEHMAETMMTLREMWDDADPDLKARMKADLAKLTSEMTV